MLANVRPVRYSDTKPPSFSNSSLLSAISYKLIETYYEKQLVNIVKECGDKDNYKLNSSVEKEYRSIVYNELNEVYKEAGGLKRIIDVSVDDKISIISRKSHIAVDFKTNEGVFSKDETAVEYFWVEYEWRGLRIYITKVKRDISV